MQTQLTKTKQRFRASMLTLCAVAVVFAVLNLLIANRVISVSVLTMLNFVGINVIAAVSLNMVTGLMGQLVLGHAGFMLVGAYAASMVVKALPWPLVFSLPVGLVVAGLAAALFGLFIGLPALRLRGDYLAIMTLGFGEIIKVVALYLPFTGGAQKYIGYATFSTRNQPNALFCFIFVVAAFTIYFSYTFGTSRHGRAVLAIREDEIAAESSGIKTTYYKLMTFALSAFFAGIAGGLLAQQHGIVDPNVYGFTKSVDILMMVVLGGMGSITGSVLSASVLTLLPEMLRGFAEYRMLLYSVLLVVVMLFRPKGLLGRREISVIPFYSKIFGKWMSRKPQEGGAAK